MICSELIAEPRQCWYSEAQKAPSHVSRSIRNGGSKGSRCERLDDPSRGARPSGEKRVGLAIEEQDDRNGFLQIADGASDRHAAHGSDLQIDYGDVDRLVSGGDRRSGRIAVVDEFVGSNAERRVNLTHHPGIVGNHQYA